MFVHPRSRIGTPEPPTNRPKLNRVGVLLAHEVGVNTPPSGRYRSADPARVLSDAKAAASYGVSAGKAWEYSFMIGLDGQVFTQAGEYRAAHCRNFNDKSAAVIFLNATDVPANSRQIEAWHELRGHMVDAGILAHDHEVAPHYRYRSTSCPGLRAQPPGGPWLSPTGQGRLGDLIPALLKSTAPTPPPTIPPTNGDHLMLYIAKPVYAGADANTPWLAVFESGEIRRALNSDVKYAQANGVAIIEQDSREQHEYAVNKFGI